MKNVQQFVSNNTIPEFIKSNHELFEAFVAAYYEWLELQKTETSEGLLDLYKNVGNPAYVASNQEKIVDIDESLESFIDFFANEVVPISLEGMQSDPVFFIKKARDMYLAKGTTNSFKLFFRLYFNQDIEVFEATDTILRASDGKWFSFPTAYFYVEEFQEQVANFDFSLSTVNTADSDRREVAVVLTGQLVDKTTSGDLVIKIQFSSEITLEKDTSYYFIQADKERLIKVKPFVSISEISLTYGGALYNEEDNIRIESSELRKKFSAAVGSVTKGNVKGVKVRDKGMYYSTTDRFDFTDGQTVNGFFFPTRVNEYGRIEEINNYEVRTGPENTGWLANNLEDVFIPLNQTQLWSKLPTISYRQGISTFDAGGLPYQKATQEGIGFQVIAVSDTIGVAQSVSLSQETFFKDSDDVFINAPATVIVENCDLTEGQIVSFQRFNDNALYGPFQDDSEYFQQIFFAYRIWDHKNNDSEGEDSEMVRKDFITLPHSWDSENFNWITSNVEIDTDNDSELGIWQPIIDFYKNNSNLSHRVFVEPQRPTDIDGGLTFDDPQVDSDIIGAGPHDYYIGPDEETDIDGGGYFGFDSEDQAYEGEVGCIDGFSGIYFGSIDGSGSFDFARTLVIEGDGYVFDSEVDLSTVETVDGGNYFDFSRSAVNAVTFQFEGNFISKLEEYHFELMDRIVGLDSEKNHFNWKRFKEDVRLIGKEDSDHVNSITTLDAGPWENMGYYGEVVAIDHDNQVAKIVSFNQSPLPTQEQIEEASREKYHVVKLSPLGADGTYEDGFSLPLTNVVHQVERMKINYKTAVVSDLYKKFWTQDGFLSSSYGGTLRDNYFYTNWSYRIKTEIPFQDWKQKFKTMLHPAGLVLSAELTENMQTDGLLMSANIEQDFSRNPRMTFDLQQEYIDLRPSGVVENADSIIYKSNAFEALTADGTTAMSLDASRQSSLPGLSERQQSGNAFWDYEPIGWISQGLTVSSDNRLRRGDDGRLTTYWRTGEPEVVNYRGLVTFDSDGNYLSFDSDYWFEHQGNIYEFWKWYLYDSEQSDGTVVTELREWLNVDSELFFYNKKSTQDSDGIGNVANTYNYYEFFDGSRQDLYKTNNRIQFGTPLIAKVQFADASFNAYPAYDSELPPGFISLFGDSDSVFRSIDYNRLKSDSDNRYFPLFKIDRASEIAILKEKDLAKAMQENGALEFQDSDVLYTDIEAYERKWNTINNERNYNNEGFVIKGDMNWVEYTHIDQRNKKRTMDFYRHQSYTKYSLVNSPLTKTIWEGGTVVWNRSYYDQVNTLFVDPSYEPEPSYRDPQVSMRKRRGR